MASIVESVSYDPAAGYRMELPGAVQITTPGHRGHCDLVTARDIVHLETAFGSVRTGSSTSPDLGAGCLPGRGSIAWQGHCDGKEASVLKPRRSVVVARSR
jgi:hypothetical protein